MAIFMCIEPSIWIPSATAIVTAIIGAFVSFRILRKQIKNNTLEEKIKRTGIVATHKFQDSLQQLSQLENASVELMNAINPHKFYDLEMIANFGNQSVITYINELGDAIDYALNKYIIRVKLISPDSDNYCEQIIGAIDDYHQILRDIQEISRRNVQPSPNTVYGNSTLINIAQKHNWDIAATIAEYSVKEEENNKIRYDNLSKSIKDHYIKKYNEVLETFEKALN